MVVLKLKPHKISAQSINDKHDWRCNGIHTVPVQAKPLVPGNAFRGCRRPSCLGRPRPSHSPCPRRRGLRFRHRGRRTPRGVSSGGEGRPGVAVCHARGSGAQGAFLLPAPSRKPRLLRIGFRSRTPRGFPAGLAGQSEHASPAFRPDFRMGREDKAAPSPRRRRSLSESRPETALRKTGTW